MIYTYIALATLFVLNIVSSVYLFIIINKLKSKTIGIQSHTEQLGTRVAKVLASTPQASPPAPNEATKEDEEEVPLSEQTPWQIPQDVKIEVEGGDSVAPYEYEVLNATS